MASAVVMMIGGAITNALAFTGGNYLFSNMGKNNDAEAERERHNKAMEQLEAETTAWNKKRTERLDFINEQLQKEHHAVQTYDDVDRAMKEYYFVTSKQLPDLQPEPTLNDFYTPSDDQKNREITFVVLGMGVTGFIAWKLIN